MKLMNKMIAVLLMLCMGNAHAYQFTFSNFTSRDIGLQFGLMGAAGWWYGTVAPGQKYTFDLGGWWAGYCGWGFEWREGKDTPGHVLLSEIDKATKEKLEHKGPKCQSAQKMGTAHTRNECDNEIREAQTVLRQLDAKKRPWRKAEVVYLPDNIYADAVKNASHIGSGFDKFFCNLSAVKALTGQCPPAFEEIIKWIGGLISRSTCTNREYEILEDDKGEIVFITYLH